MKNQTSTYIKALVAAVPYIGGTVNSVWSDIQATQAQRKIERFEELITVLQKDMKDIKNIINSEFISKPDCLDVFEQMVKYTINERINEKRNIYKNIYINSLISKICDYDKTERYMRLVEQMGLIELYLLKIFENPQKYNQESGYIIKNPFLDEKGNWLSSYMKDYYIMDLLKSLLPQYSDYLIEEGLYFLQQNRLVIEKVNTKTLKTNGDPITIFNDVLTIKGKEFIKYLSYSDSSSN